MRWIRRGPLIAAASLSLLVLARIPSRSGAPQPPAVTLRHAALPAGQDANAVDAGTDPAGRGRAAEPDNPDEFARILYEMRIPSDRTLPEYRPGYRIRELSAALRAKKGPSATLTWVNRGPGNVAGRARGLVVDPDDPTGNTWFLGSVGGGVWKTVNAGAIWTELTAGFPTLACSAIAMAPSDHDVLYVGTGESFYNIDTVNGNGVLKSTNRGQTWTHLASTIDNVSFNNIARIVVSANSPDTVLVAATPGRYKEALAPRSSIFKSVDGGTSWTEVYAETDLGAGGRVKRVLQIVATLGHANVLYATVREKGILKSTNGGTTWVLTNSGITDFTGRFELAISPTDVNLLYAAAEGASHAELWISRNSGASWARTSESGPEPNWLGAQGWYDNTIVCHPTDPNIVYVGGIRLWKIQMAGGLSNLRTSSLLLVGPVHVDNHNLVVIPGTAGSWRLVNLNDGGVGLSSDQATGWSAPIDGLTTTQFYGVDKRPGASAYIGGMQDNGTWFSSIDPARTDPWSFAIGGDGYEASWNFDDPQKIIGGYQYNGLQRSLDGGLSWGSATNGLTNIGSATAPFITKIAKTNASPDLLFAVGSSGVWRSVDFGGSWTLAPITVQWGPISSFAAVQISRASPSVVWAGQRMDGSGSIFVSTNGGTSFAPTTNYSAMTMGGISGLATHPTQAGTAYTLFSFAGRPKILRTTTYGAAWQDITGFASGSPSTNGFPDVAVYDLLVFPDDPNHMWAGTEIGLFESLDDGASWSAADNGLPNVAVWKLVQSEDEVVLGTHGRGIWSVALPQLIAGQTFRPLIDQLYQGPDGQLSIDLNLRSEYDSTQVFVDGARLTTLPANTLHQDALEQTPVVGAGTRTVFARGFKGGTIYESVHKSIDVIVLGAPVFAYQNNFDSATSDFSGNGFTVGSVAGFGSGAIHSSHPYADNQTLLYRLKVPIRVAQAEAYVAFDEIAIVEPGDVGSVFGDPNFYDYVVLEGSADGVTWIPIEAGYDCWRDPAWFAAFNAGANGDPSMFRHHRFDLLNVFTPGQTVLLRLRLFADDFVNGWGWAIDNFEIQLGSPTAAPPTPASRTLTLAQNVPNPFNPSTRIAFTLPQDGPATLRIYDLRGRRVRTLLDGVQRAGAQDIVWDGRDDGGNAVASGTYVYRLVADGHGTPRKMVLLR
jgi:hypothetical protein